MKTHGMQIDGVEGATHKFLKTNESKKRRGYAWNDRSEVASHAAGRDANFAEVRQGKELAGLASISWDIIPFGYLLSRGSLVPFWELRRLPQLDS
jgi:hypothetical protein